LKLDIATIAGILVGFGAIIVGNHLEGGHLSSVLQPTAALIVLGGTLGAVLVSFPLSGVIRGTKSLIALFLDRGTDARTLIDEIIGYARKARKDGLVSLERDVKSSSNPLLSRALLLAVDGIDSQAMRETLDFDLAEVDEQGEIEEKVFEAAGGYAPTIGILGAVLGLIHVMSNLSDVGKVGEGIAVAFVATIYGVGAANLLFLPAAAKLKLKHRHEMKLREMIVEGAIAIQQGQNPKLIESKLSAFVHTATPAHPPAAVAAEERAA
jgi:chemotaxis protein MotA